MWVNGKGAGPGEIRPGRKLRAGGQRYEMQR